MDGKSRNFAKSNVDMCQVESGPRSVHWLMFVKGRFPQSWISRWSRYMFFQVINKRLGNEVVCPSAF